MKAMWNNVVIAESSNTEVVDGNHYFPFDSIKSEYFAKAELTTVCGWKGKANYYSVTVDGKTNKDCAWYYACLLYTSPSPRDLSTSRMPASA